MVTVLAHQSLLDIALQAYGNVEGVVLLMRKNNLNLTDELSPGQLLEVPSYANASADIVSYYTNRRIKPATAIKEVLTPTVDNCNYCQCFE